MATPSPAYLIQCVANGDPPAAPALAGNNVTAVSSQGDASQLNDSDRAPDTPSNYIPGLYTLGMTYNVLNGKYADSKSTMQQVVDWSKSEVRIQSFGGREYSIPDIVNFTRNTTSDYRSSYGKTTTEYTKSLSIHAGFEASFPGFSASASADYSDSQRENLSNAFTRVTLAVTHYNLSLPPTGQIQGYLKPWFVNDLDNMDPIQLYREYGTHLLRSLTVGGRALFLYSTDTRSYKAEMSLEAAAKISASYLVASGSMDLSAKQREAMESFNESSETTVVTKGGDPRYGNEDFLKNVEAWAASIVDYPEFVDFASLPCFTGIWEFATTQARRNELQQAYAQFVKLYTADLTLPGPYLQARATDNVDSTKQAGMTVGSSSGYLYVDFPTKRSDGFYWISPSVLKTPATLAKELVPGALAPVTWEEAFVATYFSRVTRFWRAVPPTSDYIAVGFVAMSGSSASAIPSQPPAELAGQFRAVHKLAMTGASTGVPDNWVYHNYDDRRKMVFAVDYRYWLADLEVPRKADLFVLDPRMTIQEWRGW